MNKGDHYGVTPIMIASALQSYDMIKLLIEFGADCNAVDNLRSYNVLHFLSTSDTDGDDHKVAELLLKNMNKSAGNKFIE